MASTVAAEAAQPSLASLPAEIALRVLRFAGPQAAACAACTCTRLRDAQREVTATPRGCFSSALVRLAAPGAPAALAASAAAEATRQALERMESFSGLDGFALVFCSPAAGSPPRQSLAAAMDATLIRLPAGVRALGVTGSSVWGPEAAAGRGRQVRDVPRAVCVLLGRLPGCHVALSGSDYPALQPGGPVAPADSRLAEWLGSPLAGDGLGVCGQEQALELAFCAFFLAPRRQPPFEASPHVIHAWPSAALVGGVASARRGSGAVATAVRAAGAPPVVRHCRDAAALSVFAPRGDARCPRAAADATRGLRPCGSVWAVAALSRAATAEAPAPGDDPAALVPFQLRSGGRLEPAFADVAPYDSESVWDDTFFTSFELQSSAFVRVWPAGGTAAEEAAARAAARALPAECPHDGVGDAAVLLWAPHGVLGTPHCAAAMAEGRLRCQVLRVHPGAAADDAVATAARLAAAVGAPERPAAALAAACSARGSFLFPNEAEEARALAARFPAAMAGITVDGELGPPPEGGVPVLQSFTTTLAALSA